ncbi:Uncharacterised protein [Bordetella pertussis]|nr:Uncharacterised protein [Bordetella pertussis]
MEGSEASIVVRLNLGSFRGRITRVRVVVPHATSQYAARQQDQSHADFVFTLHRHPVPQRSAHSVAWICTACW